MRWRAVDSLRGLVMAVMALDHLRDFLGDAHFDVTDLAHTTVPLFLSRWITHFCAPTFFMLAGTSAALSIESGRRTVGQAARFLIVRGLVLVAVEQTLLRCFGWYFHFDYHFMNAGVLYGLGLAMVMLAGLLYLPPIAGIALGLAIIFGEPLIARVHAIPWLTESRDFEPIAAYHFYVSYPPIPWLGAMAFGYGIAAHRNRRMLVGAGIAMLVAFAALRLPANGVLDCINVDKYPPTTTFLLLTLGVALLGLAAFDRWPSRHLDVFGRVPLFFYLVHIPLIHAIAVAYSYAAFGAAWWLTSGPVVFWDTSLPGAPADYGLPLGELYVVWLALLAAMYVACWRFTSWRARAAASSSR
jgi:uncharacterized membrane protein